MDTNSPIDIIGGGIGGLTAGIALKQTGFNIRLFEQAEKLLPVGAGIILAGNAMQVYDKLGLKETIEKVGHPVHSMRITDRALRPISTVELKTLETQFGVSNTAIHRGTLQEVLLENLSTEDIQLSHELVDLKEGKDGINVQFRNGRQLQSKTLIGADGIGSVVRDLAYPKARTRFAQQMCWRGIASFSLPKEIQHQLNEAWGGILRFGFVPISSDKVYWYALQTSKIPTSTLLISDLRHLFKGFHPIIRELLDSTPNNAIHKAPIYDLSPIPHWYTQHSCLLGDAAHATTPNLGQGACQAIEDAWTLSQCLKRHTTNEAFKHYQQLRSKKARGVVNTSWKLGKLAHWQNPLAVAFRNLLLRLTPPKATLKQSENLFKLAI